MFSEKLKRLRKERGYTQQELAEKLNVSASTVGMYEQGRRKPDQDILYRMGKVLNVSVDYLLSQDEEEQQSDEDLEEIISEIKSRLLANDTLMFNGKPLNRKELERIAEVIELSVKVLSAESFSDSESLDEDFSEQKNSEAKAASL